MGAGSLGVVLHHNAVALHRVIVEHGAQPQRNVLLRLCLLPESPRRYQQHEEKEGFESGVCFHGGMVLLNCLVGGAKELRS